jgi:exopolyphosphatase/guanosine-5'-triphosphate,3'-diphosphate pyrophosphatase
MKHLAIIDIGSNSISLQISEIRNKSYDIVEDYKETIRIGGDVFKSGSFSETTVKSIIEVLERMKVLIDKRGWSFIRATATAPFRDASNAKEVIELIREKVNINVEVIDGTEEARLVHLFVSANFQINNLSALILDIGGGTTEFILSVNGEIVFSKSVPLGITRLTSDFFKNNPPKNDEIVILKEYINKTLDEMPINKSIDTIICTGGTINNISYIYNKRVHLSDTPIKYVERKFLKLIYNEIKNKTFEDRIQIEGIDQQRVDIIQTAALMMGLILNRSNHKGFFTIKGGLKNGLTIDTLNKKGIKMHFQENVDVRMARILEIGSKFSFEEEHAKQVTKLSKILFSKFKDFFKLDDENWKLLEAASMLHDTGNYISYDKHHKHSYYLIMNSDLIGYNANETEIIANIARYHRKSPPKKSHEDYKNLSGKTRNLIKKLSAILRIADALDLSHKSLVADINVKINDDIIEILPIPEKNKKIDLEIQSSEAKKDLLESITKRQVIVK